MNWSWVGSWVAWRRAMEFRDVSGVVVRLTLPKWVMDRVELKAAALQQDGVNLGSRPVLEVMRQVLEAWALEYGGSDLD